MKPLHLALAIAVLSSGAFAQSNGPTPPGKQKGVNESAKPSSPGQKKQTGETAKPYAPGQDKDAKKKKGQSKNLSDDKKPNSKRKDSKP
ncbi:hypothetical protein PHIN8_05910 [Polynucleobacter sp. HIN8]|uniref:hypothetical protein n=1 Tax=Polynucleobacter sp. HIN8 TaxID=3047867 RepID=UPI00257271F3|nr:hypothetical protein [Polynucleobacter sp. HIN8]BEI38647.1 hypothetical protein PHIN8_05910 [Polynucleobacter sp. HIN8]